MVGMIRVEQSLHRVLSLLCRTSAAESETDVDTLLLMIDKQLKWFMMVIW